MAVLAEIENNTNLEHLVKRELELPFDLSPWGHDPPAGPLVHIPVILIGFVIRGSELLLLTNPNPRGRYQTNDRLDWAGTRGD